MKNQKGITLISLIITIIVMLILAGVSLSTVIGEGSILKRAADASKITDEAAKNEVEDLQKISDKMDEILGNYTNGNLVNEIQLPENWKALVNASNDGSYVEKYPIGSLVDLELKDGSVVKYRVVAHNHDDLTSGGKAHMTLISENILLNHVMNTTDTSAGGWEATAMRNYLNGEYINTYMPDNVSNYIMPVNKKSFVYGGTVQTTSDKLWIPSYTEIGYSVETGITSVENGSAYAYFTDNTTRAKTGTNTDWGLRSARINTENRFCVVLAEGSEMSRWFSDWSPSGEIGVVIGFCI